MNESLLSTSMLSDFSARSKILSIEPLENQACGPMLKIDKKYSSTTFSTETPIVLLQGQKKEIVINFLAHQGEKYVVGLENENIIATCNPILSKTDDEIYSCRLLTNPLSPGSAMTQLQISYSKTPVLYVILYYQIDGGAAGDRIGNAFARGQALSSSAHSEQAVYEQYQPGPDLELCRCDKQHSHSGGRQMIVIEAETPFPLSLLYNSEYAKNSTCPSGAPDLGPARKVQQNHQEARERPGNDRPAAGFKPHRTQSSGWNERAIMQPTDKAHIAADNRDAPRPFGNNISKSNVILGETITEPDDCADLRRVRLAQSVICDENAQQEVKSSCLPPRNVSLSEESGSINKQQSGLLNRQLSSKQTNILRTKNSTTLFSKSKLLSTISNADRSQGELSNELIFESLQTIPNALYFAPANEKLQEIAKLRIKNFVDSDIQCNVSIEQCNLPNLISDTNAFECEKQIAITNNGFYDLTVYFKPEEKNCLNVCKLELNYLDDTISVPLIGCCGIERLEKEGTNQETCIINTGECDLALINGESSSLEQYLPIGEKLKVDELPIKYVSKELFELKSGEYEKELSPLQIEDHDQLNHCYNICVDVCK